MTNAIVTSVLQLWRRSRKTKNTNSGWISGNAPCCVHRGETADKKGRGAFIASGDNISFHCFNCGFKTGFAPGRQLSYKFRRLLGWIGASEQEVERLIIESLRLKELMGYLATPDPEPFKLPDFAAHPLPDNAVSFGAYLNFAILKNDANMVPPEFVEMVEYVSSRRIDMRKYDFYWAEGNSRMKNRVIVPFMWDDKIVGYTARSLNDGASKYLSSEPPNYVFNFNNQLRESKFVIACEGPFDAMSVDGVAILGSEISETQADIIDSLNKEVIAVPDFDKPGQKLIESAIELGWTVSFPDWRETCKDINKAVINYGKLFVMKQILAGRVDNSLKIKLKMKGL